MLSNKDFIIIDVSLFFLDHGYYMKSLGLAKKLRTIIIPQSPTQQNEEIVRKLRDTLTWTQISMAATQSL